MIRLKSYEILVKYIVKLMENPKISNSMYNFLE